jgi:hypothetical protein
LANVAVELSWIQSLLVEFSIPIRQPPVLWCDNINATYLLENPIFHARTKHVEIDFHFVCDMVASKTLVVCFISEKYQVIDIFTKPLSLIPFSTL